MPSEKTPKGRPIGDTGKPVQRQRQRQQNRPQRGDFTGRQREKDMKEHAEEIREAQARMGMMGQAQQALDEDAVLDPNTQSGGAVLEGGERAQSVLEEGFKELGESNEPIDLSQTPQNAQALRPDSQPPNFDDNLGAGQAFELNGESNSQLEVAGEHPDVQLVGGETVVVRAGDDIDQMTVGHGSSYTMEFGRQYRVPLHVAEHMEKMGLIFH